MRTNRIVSVLLIAVAGLVVALAGCQANMEPIERAKNDVKEIVVPVAQKGLAELATRTGQMNGQGSLINPGYRTRGFGGVGTFFVWDATIETVGVSANVAAAIQADQGPDIKPPATQPAKTEIPTVVEGG